MGQSLTPKRRDFAPKFNVHDPVNMVTITNATCEFIDDILNSVSNIVNGMLLPSESTLHDHEAPSEHDLNELSTSLSDWAGFECDDAWSAPYGWPRSDNPRSTQLRLSVKTQ